MAVEQVASAKSLGVYIDQTLNWEFLYCASDVQLNIVVKAETQDWLASKSVKSTNPAE